MKIVVFSRVEFDIFLETLYSIAKSDEHYASMKVWGIESISCRYFSFHVNNEEIYFYSEGITTLFRVKIENANVA